MDDQDRDQGSPPLLEHLQPRLSTWQWVRRFGLIVAGLLVLFWSYQDSEIKPWRLWVKRDNAYEYLFGRRLSTAEQTQARSLAKRQVKMEAWEEARRWLEREYLNVGKPLPDGAGQEEMIKRRVDVILSNMPPEEYEHAVDERYRSIVTDKRGGFFPPETSIRQIRLYVDALLETIAIAIWGSLIAICLAVPASLLAASRTLKILFPGRNLSKGATRKTSNFSMRRLFDACRGFNEFVMALIFVAVIGLGPFPGVLALCVHTFGILGKVFSEAIETVDDGQVEGVLATGAGSVQTIAYSVIPQIMPYVVSQSLLRFESNVRSATILGFCGAGGIGFLLSSKLEAFQFREVCTMMILVIIVVSLIDLFCSRVMRRFI